MTRKLGDKVLATFRKQMIAEVQKRYPTMEQFCWDKNLSKATVSNLIHGKKDFSLSTLQKIADALEMELKIVLKSR